ncbi:hypothetical protein OG533_32825 [Streptomyces sp. NBC_01186]|uniref:hypothetical protein n=1 Tax=Streptomyces sp. NBC_01186 TaxID=2903765 RepID=UPI002E123171|nr:hypothetical protein OG533_32825 [Streptomyces sp. NBC_01186]
MTERATEAAPEAPGEIPEGALDDAETSEGEAEDDAAWTPESDRTPETLRRLRELRRGHRSRRNRELGLAGYTVLLLVLGYGSTFGYRFARQLEYAAAQGDTAEALRRALPSALVLLALALALAAARDALWRGPVIVPRPDVAWLLGQPVDRARVLRPAFRLTASLALAAGVLCAAVGSALLWLAGLTPLGEALALCLPAGVCLPLLAAALALHVERHPSSARRVRALTPCAVLLLMALAAQAATAAAGRRLGVLEAFLLWSGPWGWAAAPVVHATGGPASGAAGAWPVAVALLVAGTLAALWHAHVVAASVPTRLLRVRAATAATVASVLWSIELRAARLAVSDAVGGHGGRARRRLLPIPRHRHLVVVWRDAVALLRAPGRLAGAALWTGAGAGGAGLAASLHSAGGRTVLLAAALLLGYLAVGKLAEPARLEADDLRRSSWSPFRFATLMLHHALVPALAGALLALLAAIPFALNGGTRALALMPLCALTFAAAAILAAVRGPVRTELLFLGLSTPFGDPSAFVFALWYTAPALVSVTGLTLALGGTLGPEPSGGALAYAVASALALPAGVLLAAHRLSGKLRGPKR